MSRSVGRAPAEPIAIRIAWWSIMAVAALVPVAIGKPWFLGLPSITYSLIAIPKLWVFAVLTGVALAAWGVTVFRGARAIRIPPLWPAILAFLALCLVSTAFALDRTQAFFGGQYNAVGLFAILIAATYFFLLVQFLTGRTRLRELSWSVVAGASVVGLVVHLESNGLNVLRLEKVPTWVLDRGAGLLGNPDFTGTYLVLPVLLSLGLAFGSESRGGRVTAWASFALLASAMVATLTRGAWAGGLVGLVIFAVVLIRSSASRKTIYALVGALVAGLVLVVLLGGAGRYAQRFEDLADPMSMGGGRVVLWTDAVKVIAERPVLGVGPDSYRLGWYGVRSVESVVLSGLSSVTEDPHNLALLAASTLGLPAAILGAYLVFAALWRTRKSALGARSGARLIFAGWWIGAVGLVVAGFFATNTTSVMVLGAAAFGVLLSSLATEVEPATWHRAALLSTALVLSSFFVVVASMTLGADMLLRTALTGDDVVGATARAAQLAPWHPNARYEAAQAAANDALAALQAGAVDAPARSYRAEAAIRAMTEDHPREYSGHALLAFFLNNAGASQGAATLQRALVAAEEAKRLYPISAEASYLKAVAQAQLGATEAAVETLSKDWDVDPRYAEAGLLYARLLKQLGRESDAEYVLVSLQSWFSDSPEVTEAITQLRQTPDTP